MQYRKSNQIESDRACVDLMITAERELASFARAVNDLFGPEQSRLAVQEWLEALESMDGPAGLEAFDFRRSTIAASGMLAHRKPLGCRSSIPSARHFLRK